MAAYLQNLKQQEPPISQASSICPIQKDEILSPLGRVVLENIAIKPLLGLVKRFKDLGFKVSHGYKIIEELISLRLILPLTIDGQRLYELTRQGENVLGKKVALKGRGGLEHRYYVEMIKAFFIQKGGFAFLEKNNLDLVVETLDKQIAIQVETGKSDIQANLFKLGKYKADQKFVLTTNRKTEIMIKNVLKDLLVPDRENIQVFFAKDFLTNPPFLSC